MEAAIISEQRKYETWGICSFFPPVYSTDILFGVHVGAAREKALIVN